MSKRWFEIKIRSMQCVIVLLVCAVASIGGIRAGGMCEDGCPHCRAMQPEPSCCDTGSQAGSHVNTGHTAAEKQATPSCCLASPCPEMLHSLADFSPLPKTLIDLTYHPPGELFMSVLGPSDLAGAQFHNLPPPQRTPLHKLNCVYLI